MKDAVMAAGKEIGLIHHFERSVGRYFADISLNIDPDGDHSVLVEIDSRPDRTLWNTSKYLNVAPAELPVALVRLRFGRAAEHPSFLDPMLLQELPDFLFSLNADPDEPDLQLRIRECLERVVILPSIQLGELGIPGVEREYEELLLSLGSGSKIVFSHLRARERLAAALFKQGRIESEDLAVILGAQLSLARRAGHYHEARKARATISHFLPNLWDRSSDISSQTMSLLRRDDVLASFESFDEAGAAQYLRQGCELIEPPAIRLTLLWRQALTTDSASTIRELLANYRGEATGSLVIRANAALAQALWLVRNRPSGWEARALDEAYTYFRYELLAWQTPGRGGTFHGVLAAVSLVIRVLRETGESSGRAGRWATEVATLMRAGNISRMADGFRELAHQSQFDLPTTLGTGLPAQVTGELLVNDIRSRVRLLVGEVEEWFLGIV